MQTAATIAILISTVLSVVSYLPQIQRLLKVKDSTGISVHAWVLSVTSLALYTVYAALTSDGILLASMGACTLMGGFILILAIKYRK